MSLNTTELQTFFKQSLESDIKSKRSYSNKFKNSGDSWNIFVLVMYNISFDV